MLGEARGWTVTELAAVGATKVAIFDQQKARSIAPVDLGLAMPGREILLKVKVTAEVGEYCPHIEGNIPPELEEYCPASNLYDEIFY